MASFAVPLLLGLLTLAAALVGVCFRYRAKPPQPLPARRPGWIAWLPKYLVEVPRQWPGDDVEVLANELQDWLAPFGLRLQSQSPTELVLAHHGQHKLECRARVTVPLPAASPLRIRLEYDAGVLFDTGDLWRLGQAMRDRDETAEAAWAAPETGNPYQSPQL